jgi:nicotinamidase/pyrazinamidase
MESGRTAVIVVDVQGDFTEFKSGALAVEGTDEAYVQAVEEGTRRLKALGIPIYATQDWHPSNHISFHTSHKSKKVFDVIRHHGKDQVLWPPHCIPDTPGAEVLLDKNLFSAIVRKGMDPEYDSYSGFRDDGGKKSKLDKILKEGKIKRVIVYGLATDYCVRATALDAIAAGFEVVLIRDLCRGVNPETSRKALEEMKEKGVVILEELDPERIKAM